jgi:hypothetical protein
MTLFAVSTCISSCDGQVPVDTCNVNKITDIYDEARGQNACRARAGPSKIAEFALS